MDPSDTHFNTCFFNLSHIDKKNFVIDTGRILIIPIWDRPRELAPHSTN